MSKRKRKSRKDKRSAPVEHDIGRPQTEASEPQDPAQGAEPVLAAPEPVAAEPEPAELEPQREEPQPSRRGFFRKIFIVLGGLAVLEYVWVLVDFLRPRSLAEGQAAIVIAGPVERFEPGTVTAFQTGKFYLSRLEDGGFLALSRECTHLGCTVPWVDDEGRFVCPCHSSEYDEKGAVVSPPAPRPLDLYAIRIENGVVKVDTGEPQKRTYFEDAQVTLP